MIEPTKKTHPITRVACLAIAVASGLSAYLIAVDGSWSAIPMTAVGFGTITLWLLAILCALVAAGIVSLTFSFNMEVQ